MGWPLPRDRDPTLCVLNLRHSQHGTPTPGMQSVFRHVAKSIALWLRTISAARIGCSQSFRALTSAPSPNIISTAILAAVGLILRTPDGPPVDSLSGVILACRRCSESSSMWQLRPQATEVSTASLRERSSISSHRDLAHLCVREVHLRVLCLEFPTGILA